MEKKKTFKPMKYFIYISICIILIIIINTTFFIVNIKKDIIKNEGFVYGNKNAMVELINYSSFECLSCKEFSDETSEFINEYIENGLIKYIYRPVDIERFKYDDFIYEHLTFRMMLEYKELSKIFEKYYLLDSIIRDKKEDFNEEKGKAIVDVLGLSNNKNIILSKKYLWNKDRLKDKGIEQVPCLYINGTKLKHGINLYELQEEIDKIIKK